ncbi:MAG: V-type ATPase 116kDa subunit family protein, partial [Candidatus Hodarchaeales archaeon]
MLISFSTDRMKIIKLCFHYDKKNDVLNYIASKGNIELIDIEKKGGFTQEGDQDQKISSLYTTFQQINSSLGTLFAYSDLNDKRKSEKSMVAFSDADQAIDAAEAFLKLHGSYLESIEDKHRLLTLFKLIKPLKTDPRLIGESKHFYTTIGQIKTENVKDVEWRLQEITSNNLVFSSVANVNDKNTSTIIAGTTKSIKPDLIRVLTSYGFNEIQVPEIINGMDGDIGKIEADIRKEEEEFLAEKCFELLALEEQLKIAKERIEASALIRKEGKHGYLAGWIPSKNAKKSAEEIKKTSDSMIVEIEDIEFPEHRYPSKMSNNRLARPYEQLVSSFGSPGYNEIDPTKIFFVMFPFLFGLMFADVLHGFFVFMLGFLGGRSKEPLVPPTGIIAEFTVYFRQGSAVFMYCGMSSMIFGFLFGSIGGLHGDANPFFKALWFLPLAKSVLQHEGYQAIDFNPFSGAWESLPTSTFDGQFALLEVSILVAAIVLSLGLFLNFYTNWKHGHRIHAITLPGTFLLFYFGL